MPFYFFLIGDRHGRNALYIAFSTAMWRLTYSFGPLAFSVIFEKNSRGQIFTEENLNRAKMHLEIYILG